MSTVEERYIRIAVPAVIAATIIGTVAILSILICGLLSEAGIHVTHLW